MTPERIDDLRAFALSFPGGTSCYINEALDEIERLQRERDALLKLHRAVYEAFTEDLPPELQDAVKRAHNEASRVLAEGKVER